MADVLEGIEEGETIVILLLIAAGGYLLYTGWNALNDWLGNLMGASKENTYANAANQTLTHPIDTLESIIGLNQTADTSAPAPLTAPSKVPGNATIAQSIGGYDKLGASGQMWSCSGPSGSPGDMCTPVSCDANGNCNATGAAVPAAQAN